MESAQTLRGASADLEGRIISAIGAVGPRNVAKIARLTGANQETVRYKVNKRFSRLGFRFHAEVDCARLGLSLHWATLEFTRNCSRLAPQVLTGLNEVGYLIYYARLVPQGGYISLFTLPSDTSDQYLGFLKGLKERGILAGFELTEVSARRHKVMDSRFFNFRSGRWEIEWAEIGAAQPSALVPGTKPHAEDFDYSDFLVIKELQKDALQHLTTMAKTVGLHRNTLEYHYRTHIQKLKLVPSYRVRWAQDIAKRPIHSTVFTRMAFRRLTESEFGRVQTAVSKVPLMWTEELLNDGTYLAMMYVPLTDIINVSSYVSSAVPDLGSKMEKNFIDFANATSFTIPYNMYRDGDWKFDVRRMEAALRRHSTIAIEN